MKFFASQKITVALPLLSSLLLAACGGGGGDSPATSSTNTSTLTASNVQAVSAQAVSGSNGINGGASSSSLVTGVSVSTTRTGLIDAALQQVYKGAALAPAGNLVTGVTINRGPLNCSGGGTISVSLTAAVSGTVSNDDSMSISATNCVENGAKLNGGFSLTFSNMTGTFGTYSAWGATMAFKFSKFSVEENNEISGLNGDLALAFVQHAYQDVTFTASGTSLQSTLVRNAATIVNQTLTAFNDSGTIKSTAHTFNTNFTFTNNLATTGTTSYLVKTINTFARTGTSYPYTGKMTITAADKSIATVTALDSTNVRIELDNGGDGTIDQTINTTWAALESSI